MAVFDADADRAVYLDLLRERADQYRLLIWAWCPMDTHIHLLAAPNAATRYIGRSVARTPTTPVSECKTPKLRAFMASSFLFLRHGSEISLDDHGVYREESSSGGYREGSRAVPLVERDGPHYRN
jgi:hypothetical protein